jgi:hypothetical protein
MRKDDQPVLPAWHFNSLVELDLSLHRHIHNGKGGLSKPLRERDLLQENFTIPEYFEFFDVRKPASLYIHETLNEIIEGLFAARLKLEKTLGRSELVAHDQVLASYLTHDVLFPKLRREVFRDYNDLSQGNQLASHGEDSKTSDQKQTLKTRNFQPIFNKGVENEDAFYKWMAYSGVREQQRMANYKETMNDPVLYAGFESFENFYQENLLADAKRPARKIDPKDFKPKPFKAEDGTTDRKEQGYMDSVERRDQFFENYMIYKENGLEQKDRVEAYYVLEQFFKKH